MSRRLVNSLGSTFLVLGARGCARRNPGILTVGRRTGSRIDIGSHDRSVLDNVDRIFCSLVSAWECPAGPVVDR